MRVSLRRFLVTVLILAAVLPVVASEQSETVGNRQFDMALKLSPYALQSINYAEGIQPSNRTSEYGLGAGVNFFYNFGSGCAVGTNVSYEFHNFSSFHKYHDLKADARFRYRFANTDDNRFRAFFSVGGGLDFVFRDDNDNCAYPLVVGGLEIDYMTDSVFSFNAGVDLGYTFQKDSSVFNLTTFIGGKFHFGEAR